MVKCLFDLPEAPALCRGPLWLQLVEEIHGVQHLAVSVVKLYDTAVDQPHGEHFSRSVASGNAAAAVDSDIFLKISRIFMVGTKLNEEPDHHFPHVCGIHVQTHHKQPPVAVWSDDLMSHAGGTVTSSPNLTEGWFPITRCSNRLSLASSPLAVPNQPLSGQLFNPPDPPTCPSLTTCGSILPARGSASEPPAASPEIDRRVPQLALGAFEGAGVGPRWS